MENTKATKDSLIPIGKWGGDKKDKHGALQDGGDEDESGGPEAPEPGARLTDPPPLPASPSGGGGVGDGGCSILAPLHPYRLADTSHICTESWKRI